MGIPKFYKWVKETFPNCISNTLPTTQGTFLHTLEFDMGGLFHCSYSYGDGYSKTQSKLVETLIGSRTRENKFRTNILSNNYYRIAKITMILAKETNKEYKRVNNLVIAMDGVAVFAKIMQQCSCCYRSGPQNEVQEYETPETD